MNAWIFAGLGVPLAAALAFWAGRRVDAPDGTRERAQPAATLAAPAAERVVVLRTIERDGAPTEAAAAPSQPPAEAGEDPEPGHLTRRDYERMSSDEIAASEKDEQRARYELLDGRFDGQTTDRQWSYSTEQQLTTAIDGIPPTNDVQLASVECRSDICKTTLEHPPNQPVTDFMQAFVMSGMSHLEHHFRYEEGRVIVYSLRPEQKTAGR